MDDQPPRKDPLRALTFAGRLLLLATLIVGAATFYWFMMFVVRDMPVRSYPVAFLLIPVAFGCGIFFILVSLILGAFRIRVWRDDSDDSGKPPPQQPPGTGDGSIQ